MESTEDWDAYLESEEPVIIQAGASWCGPCGMLKPMLVEVSKEFQGKVKYVYMDIDKFPAMADILEIQFIPKTFMIFKGELVDQFGGVPQESAKIKEFFQRASDLADGKEE
uniref:Thioredoxin domain-containing protein n=1 Tax=Strombidium rassoulzadegani TaxID=1082188 RepID=A0A7S3FVW0_9SPIT|mmetsp:Transcript_2191/g.3820  ORF Transcript_2191/g.3820 Transcript_2191/m.3820 type:complete len:111 (+) Transcript_2191:263-595(+)|eukprot:CAMPEP_0168628176 /NCGR_PEP_ID=MMETSP0449_2-20121227/11700_1 /TAXON_ID=1082188 /ORGANISM="Strombidium rassoulzadegani, Strain ras09" /LENGTH=110 /DNA_ID=CAMNT_0008670569 /DNA_START=225 /DNA_END=557 /DNA_ORIENTATION=-